MRTRITPGPYRDNLVSFIGRLAQAGKDDPTIAAHLGISASQVGRLRRAAGIPAGDPGTQSLLRRVRYEQSLRAAAEPATTPEDPR